MTAAEYIKTGLETFITEIYVLNLKIQALTKELDDLKAELWETKNALDEERWGEDL